MKKILIIATVDSHINNFHLPFIEMFNKHNYVVDIATNGNYKFKKTNKKFKVSFSRNPFSIKNIIAYFQMKKILKNGNYSLIQTNTPTASLISRLAAKKYRKNNLKVIYMAHGFHFFKGAPWLYNTLFLYLEKKLSSFTDLIITMNKEDFENARKFYCEEVININGVGIYNDNFKCNKKILNKDKLIAISVGELTKRKNQILAIKGVQKVISKGINLTYNIVGSGARDKFLKRYIKRYNLSNNIKLLGYRKDIPSLLCKSDIFISTSKHEGLPVNILEAISANKIIIATNCRGNNDLILNEINGLLIDFDSEDFLNKFMYLYNNTEQLSDKFSKYNSEIKNKYEIDEIVRRLEKVYFS